MFDFDKCLSFSGSVLGNAYALDEVLWFHCWWKADLISVWKKVHAMKWLFIYRRDLVVIVLFILFLHFFVSFEYDFHLDTERMIVKPQKNVKKYLRRWFKQNNVGHDISSIWKYCRYL